MRNLATNPAPWLVGTLVAFSGVALARFAPPLFDDAHHTLVVAIGRFLALAGLVVIMLGVHRRLDADHSPNDTP